MLPIWLLPSFTILLSRHRVDAPTHYNLNYISKQLGNSIQFTHVKYVCFSAANVFWLVGQGLGNLNRRVIQAHVESMDKDHLKLKKKNQIRKKGDLILILSWRIVWWGGGAKSKPKGTVKCPRRVLFGMKIWGKTLCETDSGLRKCTCCYRSPPRAAPVNGKWLFLKQ